MTCDLLGFDGVITNSIDATSSRDVPHRIHSKSFNYDVIIE